ncbi:MAG TPA: hypothetical protein ENK85_08085 [Saprospiraceae bacterium]|nr:hypothetical protein [Saprospiraceae bacterium]
MKEKYLDDLQEIRSIMERSKRFLSLSGAAGIAAGIFALIGAYVAYREIYFSGAIIYDSSSVQDYPLEVIKLLIIAIVVLLASLGTGIWLSLRKAQKAGEAVWSPASKKLVTHAMVPLVAGGLLILVLLNQGHFGMVAGVSLIFYGLALFQAGNFTFSDVKFLGLIEILTGLLAVANPGSGLYFWAFGFGVLHIIYGTIMHFKYDRNH